MIVDLRAYTSVEELSREFAWNIPQEFNVATALVDVHADTRDSLALLYESEDDAEAKYTFRKIRDLANSLANVLKSRGVAKGDTVGIVLSQRPETAISHIAIYKLGAVAVPLSILYGPDTLEQTLNDSGARVVVVEEQCKDRISTIRGRLSELEHVIVVGTAGEGETEFWSEVDAASPAFETVKTAAEDPAIILFTGGTTGPPKGILLAHRCFLGYVATIQIFYNLIFDEETVFWTPSDWAWGGGLLDLLLPAWYFGRPVVAYDGRFDPEKAFGLMEKYRVTNTFMVPTALKRLMGVEKAKTRWDLDLRIIACGGEAATPEILSWAREVLGAEINEFYGLTEAGHIVANCSTLWKAKAGSMGMPYPWREVGIIDDNGQPLPPGHVGQIVVRKGDPVEFLGYWGKPEETERRYKGDWILTGDLAERDEEGYYYFRGRHDDLIGSAGYRIGPSEVETEIKSHPTVAEAAVVASPDADRGSIVKAFVRLSPGQEPSESLKKEIQGRVKENLAAYKYPRELEFVDELPTTTHGKIDRKALRRREEERKRVRP